MYNSSLKVSRCGKSLFKTVNLMVEDSESSKNCNNLNNEIDGDSEHINENYFKYLQLQKICKTLCNFP